MRMFVDKCEFRANDRTKIENKKYSKPISLNLNFIHFKNYYITNFSHFQFNFEKRYKSPRNIFKKKFGLFELKSNLENRREFFEKLFILPSSIIFVFDKKEKNFSPNYSKNVDYLHKRLISFKNKKKINDYRKTNENYKTLNFKLKEEDFVFIDLIYNLTNSFLFIGILSLFANSFSNRIFKKIDLPDEYDPEKISSYFRLRPDKILIRFSQILLKCIKFSSMLVVDQFISQNKKLNYSIQNKNTKTIDFLVCKQNSLIELFKNNFIDKNLLKNFKFLRMENTMIFLKIQKKIIEIFYWKNRNNERAKQLREIVSTLSPAFIKLAQAFASRPDVVGEKTAKELQRLQDDMPFFSNEIAFNFIKRELGGPSSKIFSEISKSPVAAASLGQVYRAVLDGIHVAVKVQRPGLAELLALDIIIIRFLAFGAQKILNIRTDLVAAVDEYAYRLFEELDYRKEASNMIKFRSLYGYMDRIYIPKVFLDYSSQHVLVMEWVEGDRLVKNSVTVLQEDISLIEVGVRCSLVQLLEVGFLHCDPHGGNLIKTKDGKLAYIDFGLVSEIPESVRYSLIISSLHLINREYKLLARDFTGLALIRNDDLDKEIQNFSSALSDTFDKSALDFDTFTFQDATEKIFRLTVKFPYILPPYFLNNLRAIATLEGIALMADSRFKISDVIYPYIINRLLTNQSIQFRAALEDFLIDNNTLEPNWNRLQTLLKDPEWNETFSDQSENLSDTILSFIISSTGGFLKRMVLRDIVNALEKYILILFSIISPKKTKKTKWKGKQINKLHSYKKSGNILNLIFYESKIYSIKNLLIFIKLSFLSSILVFTEMLIRLYNILICKFDKKKKILS
jgi:predicted unusual protein kinase regulating ubiquinone biosynthesis (AarF/ABC1/UbiB family)